MRLLLTLLLLTGLSANAQPLWRNFFSTNQNPRVTVVAGSNATVQASTIGTDQRIFTVNAVPSAAGAQTNVAVVAPGSAINVATNGPAGGYTEFVISSTAITNGDTRNLQFLGGITNTSAAGFVGNGGQLTNVPFSFWTNYTTNPLDFTNLNGLAFGSGLYGMTSYWDWAIAPGVGPIGIWYSGIDTNTVITTNGGSFYGRILDLSGTAIAPSSNQLVTASWVRNLFNVGAAYYNSTNIDSGATNTDMPDQYVYKYQSTIPISDVRSYTTANFLTNNGYVGAVVTTNTFPSLGGAIVVSAYFGFTGGNPTPTLSVKPEIYISSDKTNWYNEVAATPQNITWNSTNLYQWLIDFPNTTATNATGFYVQRRFKVVSTAGNGTARNLYVFVGTNVISGTADAAHLTMQSPTATAGNAYLANEQLFTGSNSFSGGMMMWGNASKTNGVWLSGSGEVLSNAVGSVTISGGSVVINNPLQTNFFGGTNYIGWVSGTNAAIYADTNGPLQFRNVVGGGTNIMFIDRTTGALMWNTDNKYNIGGSSDNRPKNMYLSGSLTTVGGIGGSVISASTAGSFRFGDSARTRLYSPADGSFRVTDKVEGADRFYLNGPVKALTDATAVPIFQVNVFTNSTVKSAFVGGVIDYTINCIDAEGGENQTLSGIVAFAACNTNGVFFNLTATEVAANQAKSVTSGTLTTTWTLTPKTSYESTNLLVNVSADTSLTPAANKFYILWQMRSNGTNTVTAL